MLQAMRLPGPSSIHSTHRARLMATATHMPKSKQRTTTGLPPLPLLKPKQNPDGPLRPQLNVDVDPNHGLWAFFRKNVDKDGNATYETVEPRNNGAALSSRSWTAAELRRKSFKDLHTLWYIALRERNLLATQDHQIRAANGRPDATVVQPRVHSCRKTMARIKYIVNERRLAYEDALNIMNGQKEAERNAKKKPAVLKREEQKASLLDEADRMGLFDPAPVGSSAELSDESSSELSDEPSPVAEGQAQPGEPVKKEKKPIPKYEDVDIHII